MIVILLHIGQDISIFNKDIVAIVDLASMKDSQSNLEFLQTAEDEGFIVSLTDKPHSYIITVDKVYLSPISAITLGKRLSGFPK